MDSKNLDYAFEKINGFITFETGDRKSYMDDLKVITNHIIRKLKDHDEVFRQLYNGHYFQGSYMDNLKITKPDEYDIIIQLKLPKFQLAKIDPDKNKPGNVLIDITEILDKMTKQTETQKEIHKRLQEYTNNLNFLDQKKISSWFQSMFYNILGNNSTVHLNINGTDYKIVRKTSGPAQTIKIYNNYKNIKISIDYVPGFRFTESQWVAERKYISDNMDWLAIPKPDNSCHNDKKPNISFRSSFSNSEREIISGKKQLKNICKLLKKLRDRWNIQNLKSYHIKTLFLWENEIQSNSFWNKPTSYLFMHMFKILIEKVKINGEIKFFWDSKQNMLENLKPYQLQTMAGQLESIYEDIEKLRHGRPISNRIYELFLTKNEIEAMNQGINLENAIQNENSTSQNEAQPTIDGIGGYNQNNESFSIGSIAAVGAISVAVGALVIGALNLFGSNRNQN